MPSLIMRLVHSRREYDPWKYYPAAASCLQDFGVVLPEPALEPIPNLPLTSRRPTQAAD